MKTETTLIAGAIVAAVTATAQGGLSAAAPVVIDQPSSVNVSFVSQSAGATGSLYFLGWEPEGIDTIEYAASSDFNILGTHLMSNHGTPFGTSVDVGTFGAGTLHFAYLITDGVSVAPTGSLFRTDVSGDEVYFASEMTAVTPQVYTFGLEDIRNPSQSDWDYNDLVVQVSAAPIPAPGATVIGLASVLVLGRVRRRRA